MGRDLLGRDLLLRSMFHAAGQPAHAQIGSYSWCLWVTAGDRSFPSVLARTWHTTWMQPTGTVLLVVEQCSLARVVGGPRQPQLKS